MTAVTYREAINRAIGDTLAEDGRAVLFGEDVARAGGVFKTTEGLWERFGDKRVLDTPISEQAIVGTAIGAAIRGLHPIAEIMFADFAAVCFDGIANELAKYRYMTDGQVSCPVTIRMVNGAGAGFAAQHSQPAENWFLNVPGLKIAVPGTPADAYGLLRASAADQNPVLFFEHKRLLALKGELPEPAQSIELGSAAIVREGRDVTVVATQQMRHRALEAAERLATEGVSVELIDPRTLVPFDLEAVLDSVSKTGRLVVVQEAPRGGSWGAGLVAAVAEEGFDRLAGPPLLVAADDTPIPYAESLEGEWLPSVDRIATALTGAVLGAPAA
jgi:pyruvate dehydrogenase E1 component beta subunit